MAPLRGKVPPVTRQRHSAMRGLRWVPAAPAFIGLLGCWVIVEGLVWLGMRLGGLCEWIVGRERRR